MRELKTSEVQEVSGGLFGLFGLLGWGRRRSYHGHHSACGRRSYSHVSSCARPTYRRSRCGW